MHEAYLDWIYGTSSWLLLLCKLCKHPPGYLYIHCSNPATSNLLLYLLAYIEVFVVEQQRDFHQNILKAFQHLIHILFLFERLHSKF